MIFLFSSCAYNDAPKKFWCSVVQNALKSGPYVRTLFDTSIVIKVNISKEGFLVIKNILSDEKKFNLDRSDYKRYWSGLSTKSKLFQPMYTKEVPCREKMHSVLRCT